MKPSSATVAERIRLKLEKLTRAERQLANALMADYPVAGLSSISEFARVAGVSTPTVMRMAKKLGFTGFPGFQQALREELSEQLQTPLTKHERMAGGAPDEHILNRFSFAAIDNLRNSLKLVDHRDFDRLAHLLATAKGNVWLVGGRLTHTLANYLARHLQMLRPRVHLLPEGQSLWAQHLLEMGKEDVLVVFDVRRYDPDLFDLAQLAKRRGVRVVLFTDQWMSPVASLALHALPLRIEVPSGWDSGLVPLFMIEALIAAVLAELWPGAADRLEQFELQFAALKRKR